jgi:hypothetical protein
MKVVPIKNVKREEIRRFITSDVYQFKTTPTTLTLRRCLNEHLLLNINQVNYGIIAYGTNARAQRPLQTNQSSLSLLKSISQFDKLKLLCKYINHLAVHLSQEYLISLLKFCCSHQIQVHRTWQDDEERRVEIITNII